MRYPQTRGLGLTVLLESPLGRPPDPSCQRIVRPGLVIDAAFERAAGADQRIERLAYIRIDGAGGVEGRLHQSAGGGHQERFVIAQEFFRDAYILVRKRIRFNRRRALMLARLLEIRTVPRAIDSDFALSAAADGADIGVHAGTKSAGFANLAYRAGHSLSIEV